ncbi:MAG: Hint domain-containing protein [Gemmobacter sp.]
MFMQDFTRIAPFATVFPALPVTTGLAAGTPVETRGGWRAVETLRPGDVVQTLDGGLARIAAMDRTWALPAMQVSVLDLAGGAFGNCGRVTLLPDQHLLLDLDAADQTGDLPDALGALFPANALDGHRGVTRRTVRAPLEVVTLMFAEEELVWAASGLLLHCPAVRHGAGSAPQGDIFPSLPAPAARRLLAARRAEDAALPGWCA